MNDSRTRKFSVELDPYGRPAKPLESVRVLAKQSPIEIGDFASLSFHLTDLAARRDYLPFFTELGRAQSIYSEPEHIAALTGFQAMLRGDLARAAAGFRFALSLNPRLEVFTPLAMASMPGPPYSDHLRVLHSILHPQTYLEIGIFMGDTLRFAEAETNVIGIDPSPALRKPCAPNTEVYGVTSDQFFAEWAPSVLTKLPPISLAFIDGMHLFEQVLLDFINVETYCDPRGVVALHDTLPIAEVPSGRFQNSRYWCGDVWKVVNCLEHFRPDLHILTLPTFPSGLTLLAGLDPTNNVLRESFQDAIQQFSDQPFSKCEELLARAQAAVPNDFTETSSMITTGHNV